MKLYIYIYLSSLNFDLLQIDIHPYRYSIVYPLKMALFSNKMHGLYINFFIIVCVIINSFFVLNCFGQSNNFNNNNNNNRINKSTSFDNKNNDNRNRLATCVANSHYECGKQIGKQQAARIQKTLQTKHAQTIFQYVNQTVDGNKLYIFYLKLHLRVFPNLVDEINGTSIGAKVDFQALFALNIEFELIAKGNLSTNGFRKGCSDYHLFQPNQGINYWGHNEDGDINDKENGFYFVSSTINNQSYFAFSYSGRLPGWAWGFNNAIIQTINGLYVNPSTKPGLGINFIARDLLNSHSMENAIERANRDGQDGGSHFNIGSISMKQQLSIETSWEGTTVQYLNGMNRNWYAHFNAYLHTDKPPFGDYTSSIHRMARVSTIATRSNELELKNIGYILDVLGDKTTKPYCLNRCNTREDPYITFCTLTIDLENSKVRVYTDRTSKENIDNYWVEFDDVDTINISRIKSFLPRFPY